MPTLPELPARSPAHPDGSCPDCAATYARWVALSRLLDLAPGGLMARVRRVVAEALGAV